MKTTNYITGLAALLFCTACSNDEMLTSASHDEVIEFGATLQIPQVIKARNLGQNKGDIVTLPYINGIHVRKMEDPTPQNSEYNVKNGNKGTLEIKIGESRLEWTNSEKNENTQIHFYSWTTPDGVTIATGSPTTGTIDFSDTQGNRAPKSSTDESDLHKIDETYVAPLEVFISAHAIGSYKDNPTVSLPFTHPIAKVKIRVYNWDNEDITNDVTIKFPFINTTWKVVQNQDNGTPFAVTEEEGNSNPLSLELSKVWNKTIFYLPPITFSEKGDFEITVNGNTATYYGTLSGLSTKELKAGEYMELRIDLNTNYGTGVGAYINPWKFGKEDTAYANPYRGIYTTEGLKVLKDCLSASPVQTLPDSLYLEEGGKKIIRLYNDLDVSTLTPMDLPADISFDGLGHTVTTASGHNLFNEVKANDIRNIRIAGDGLLATSVEGSTLYNCHAGTGNLVETAKGTTKFEFCSAENTGGTLMGTAEGNNIAVSNSFVASSATTFANTGTTNMTNSFIIGTTNTYWASNGVSTAFTIDPNKVTATMIGGKKFIDLLNGTPSSNSWVYVYGKSYPVMRIH